jgi:hypothetical protein
MIVIVVILLSVAFLLFLRSAKRTSDSMILKHALYEHEVAKEKIRKTFLNGNEFGAKSYYQEEIGRLKHHLQLAKLSYDEINTLLEDFKSWYSVLVLSQYEF